MMKKIVAGLLEVVHLAANALVFAMAAWVARIPAPVRAWKGAQIERSMAAEVSADLTQVLLDIGPWIAGFGLFAVAAAGFLRGDGKRMLPLVRLTAAGLTLLFSLWASLGLPQERLPHAWNCLFIAAAADLACTAFLVGGKGGGSKSSASKSEK